jgi:hypothetical protein
MEACATSVLYGGWECTDRNGTISIIHGVTSHKSITGTVFLLLQKNRGDGLGFNGETRKPWQRRSN